MSGVSATALQGPLEAGLWGSSRGSHREGGGGISQFWRVGVTGEGIKRWGIEGIRIGTSDRFVRGRGELVRPLYDITLL